MAENELQQVHGLLIELQDVLRKKFALESEITALPENLKDLQNKLAEANQKYLALTEKYNAAKEDVTSNSIKYEDAFAERTNAEKQMDTISTQREYEALSKQIDEAKVRENGLLKARNAANALVEELKAQLDEQEAICDQLKEAADSENAKIDETIAAKKEEIAAYEAQCQEIKDRGVSDDLYQKFSNIVKNKKGVGIVPIHGLVCQGCHMILPQQFVNDVRLDNNTEYCPYCSRILYYEESEDTIDLSDLTDNADDDNSLAESVDEDAFDDIL